MIISIKPEPPAMTGAQTLATYSPRNLLTTGFTMPVVFQTPAVLCAPPHSKPLKSVQIMALFDTGASKTYIAGSIADLLELTLVGFSKTHTASGIEDFPNYAVDVLFPNDALRGFSNMQIGSCNLSYSHTLTEAQRIAPDNCGALIGRDMMARWSIVWHGPTSTVFISE